MQKILTILGPTASGKTSLAIALAKEFGGEVISADSRQVYRGLDIGTGKVTQEEMDGVPHHLLDVADPWEQYTVADFVRDATAAIDDISNRGKLPIIAGGTFFYIDALLGRTAVPEVPPNEALRRELEERSTESLFATLQNLDPDRAATIEPENKRRLIRALEIIEALGKVPEPECEDRYDTLLLAIERSKEELRERFEKRATIWTKNDALENEVAMLIKNGVTRDRLLNMGFEYQLGLERYDGILTKQEFVEKFIEKNWQYARQQFAWLKRYEDVHWIAPALNEETRTLVRNWYV